MEIDRFGRLLNCHCCCCCCSCFVPNFIPISISLHSSPCASCILAGRDIDSNGFCLFHTRTLISLITSAISFSLCRNLSLVYAVCIRFIPSPYFLVFIYYSKWKCLFLLVRGRFHFVELLSNVRKGECICRKIEETHISSSNKIKSKYTRSRTHSAINSL